MRCENVVTNVAAGLVLVLLFFLVVVMALAGANMLAMLLETPAPPAECIPTVRQLSTAGTFML